MKQVTIVSLLVSIVLCFSSCSQVEDYEWKEVDIKVNEEIGTLMYFLFKSSDIDKTYDLILDEVIEGYIIDNDNLRVVEDNKDLSKNVIRTMNKYSSNVSTTVTYDEDIYYIYINIKQKNKYKTIIIPATMRPEYEED